MKSLQMPRKLLSPLIIACLAFLPGCRDSEVISVEPPPASGASVPPEPAPSILQVPVSVSMDTLRDFAERAIPQRVAGDKGLPNFGPASGNSISWSLARSRVTVSGDGGQLGLGGGIGGSVSVKGSIKPIRGDIGKLLGKVAPSQPYSQSAAVAANLTASAVPQLLTDWSIRPNLSARAEVSEASARIAGIFDLSFRGELQGPVDDAVNRAVGDLTGRISADRTLRTKAAEAWAGLCRPLPVRARKGSPELSLRIEPRAFEATQPTIGPAGVRIDLGLLSVIRVVPADTPVADCPPLPDRLDIVPSTDGVSSLVVDTSLGYDAVNAMIEAERAGRPVIKGPGVEAELSRVTLGPLGEKLLLAVEGNFRETGLFGAGGRGTVYLSATPKLDAATQRLTFGAVDLDTRSETALGTIAAGFAAALSPLIESRLESIVVDLKPAIDRARIEAGAAIVALGDGGAPVRIKEGRLDDLRITGLWHDDAGIHVRVEARGRLAFEVTRIEP